MRIDTLASGCSPGRSEISVLSTVRKPKCEASYRAPPGMQPVVIVSLTDIFRRRYTVFFYATQMEADRQSSEMEAEVDEGTRSIAVLSFHSSSDGIVEDTAPST